MAIKDIKVVNTRKQMTEGLSKNLSENFAKSLVKKASDENCIVKKVDKDSRSSVTEFTSAINHLVEAANSAEELKSFGVAYIIDHYVKKAVVEYSKTSLIKKAGIGDEESTQIDMGLEMPEEARAAMESFTPIDDAIDIIRKIAEDANFRNKIARTAMKIEGDMLMAVVGNEHLVRRVMKEVMEDEMIVFADEERMMNQLVKHLSWNAWARIWAKDIMKPFLKLGDASWDRLFEKAKERKGIVRASLLESVKLLKKAGINNIVSEIECLSKLLEV